MAFIKVGKEWLDDVYAENVVKPNEFREVVNIIFNKEVQARKKGAPHAEVIEKGFLGLFTVGKSQARNDESYYFNLSPNSNNLLQAIIDIAYNSPEKLLITKEESQYLIFAEAFRSKSAIIRDCSDLLKSEYLTEDFIYIDKKTAWAAQYLIKHATTGRVILTNYREGKI